MYRIGTRPSSRAVHVVILVALVLAVLPGARAHADPTVAEIEALINQKWNEAEPLIERYNAVHEQYKKNKAKQAQLQKQIEPLQREVDLGQARVGAMAAEIYKGGQADAFNAVLTSGSPRQLAEQSLAFLDMLASEHERQLHGVTELKASTTRRRRRSTRSSPSWPRRTPSWRRSGRRSRRGSPSCSTCGGRPTAAAAADRLVPALALSFGVRADQRLQGRRIRVRAGGQALRLGGRRSERLRLLGADLGIVEAGRGVPAAQRSGAAPVDAVREPGQPAHRRSRLLLQQPAPRRHLRGRRQGDDRADTATTCAWRTWVARRSTATADPADATFSCRA